MVPLIRQRQEEKLAPTLNTVTLSVDIAIFQEGDFSEVRANLRTDEGSTFYGEGYAKRHPNDHSNPGLGVNLAFARAMQDAFREGELDLIDLSMTEAEFLAQQKEKRDEFADAIREVVTNVVSRLEVNPDALADKTTTETPGRRKVNGYGDCGYSACNICYEDIQSETLKRVPTGNGRAFKEDICSDTTCPVCYCDETEAERDERCRDNQPNCFLGVTCGEEVCEGCTYHENGCSAPEDHFSKIAKGDGAEEDEGDDEDFGRLAYDPFEDDEDEQVADAPSYATKEELARLVLACDASNQAVATGLATITRAVNNIYVRGGFDPTDILPIDPIKYPNIAAFSGR